MSSKGSAAPLFAALGDPTRLRLLGRCPPAGRCRLLVSAKDRGDASAITRHLHALGHAGLVRHARRGREQSGT